MFSFKLQEYSHIIYLMIELQLCQLEEIGKQLLSNVV